MKKGIYIDDIRSVCLASSWDVVLYFFFGWTALAHSSDFERKMLDFFDSKFSMSCMRYEVLTALNLALSTNAIVPSFDENPHSLILLENARF